MKASIAASFIVGGALGKSFFGATKGAQRQINQLGKSLKETNKRLSSARAVTKYKSQLEELRQKQSTLGRSSDRLDRGIAEVERRYREAKREAKSYGIEIGTVVREQKRLERQSAALARRQKATARASAAGGRLGSMRGTAIGLAGLGFGAARVIGSAMETEESALFLRSVINSPDRDAALGESLRHAREFARESLATENEILQIEYQFNSAGLDADIARQGTEIAAKVAKVTRGESGQVANVVGTVFNNLGDSLEGETEEKLATIGNILTKAQFKFQISDFAQLGEGMAEAASGAAAYRVSLDQTAAAIGRLNTAGLSGSRAGTAFNAVLRKLGSAGEELGFSIQRGADGQLDFVATLRELDATLDGLDTDERAAILQERFGEEGMKGIIPLLGKIDELRGGVDELNAAAEGGLLDEEYERFLESASGQWTMFTQNIALVGRTIGGIVLPALNALLAPLRPIAGWAATMVEKFPVISHMLGAVAAGAIAMGSALAIVTAATWAWNVALAANPIGLTVIAIVGAVAMIGAAIGLLWKNWDRVWGWIVDKVKTAFGFFWQVFKWSPLGLVMQGWGKMFEWIAGKFGWLGKTVKALKNFFGFGDEDEEGEESETERNVAEAARGRGRRGRRGRVPGLAETASVSNNATRNQADNRSITINVTSDDPAAAAGAVRDAVDERPKYYDIPLDDALAF